VDDDPRSSSPSRTAKSGGGSRKMPVFTVVTNTGFLDVCLRPPRSRLCSFFSFESSVRTKCRRQPRSSSPSSSVPPPPPPLPITMNDDDEVSPLLPPTLVPFSRIVSAEGGEGRARSGPSTGNGTAVVPAPQGRWRDDGSSSFGRTRISKTTVATTTATTTTTTPPDKRDGHWVERHRLHWPLSTCVGVRIRF